MDLHVEVDWDYVYHCNSRFAVCIWDVNKCAWCQLLWWKQAIVIFLTVTHIFEHSIHLYAWMCLSPVLVCVSSFVAFWPVFLCAEELLPVFNFAEPLLETEPSSLGNLLWVAMETEAAISRQRVVRSSFTDRLAHPLALLVTWVNSPCVTKTPPPVLLKRKPQQQDTAEATLFLSGGGLGQQSSHLNLWYERQEWTEWSKLLHNDCECKKKNHNKKKNLFCICALNYAREMVSKSALGERNNFLTHYHDSGEAIFNCRRVRWV